MSRKGNAAVRPQEQEPAGWPVEWTCAGFIVLIVAVLSQAGRLMPSLFVGQCTALSGMCTPARCTCAAPLRKRELVTQDAQVCYQCVTEFCPAVSEGDLTCTTASCECDDPTWPRVDVQVDGEACWQCVRPPVDFTARIGASDETCLAVAGGLPSASASEDAAAAAPTGVAGAAAGSARRLVHSRNRSQCVPLRYNGARITEKQSNRSCLAWSAFGSYWGLVECDMRDPLMHFNQLSIPEAAAGSSQEIYCSGENSSEFCIEVADILCTEEEGRCSTEKCRCEDPSWTRQELQTLNGSHCYSCSPPPVHCETSEDTCTPGACACSDPSHVKVLANPAGSGAEDALGQPPCFRCQPPPSRNSEASMLATFVLFVIAGLAGGCFVRRLRDPVAPSGTGKKLKRQLASQATDGPRSWSERWAEELEDLLEGLYEAFVENPAMLVRWVRPHLRQVGKVAGNALDYCDLALEPVYCAIDFVQAWLWDTLVIQHERLVAAVGWVCDRYNDVAQLVSRGFQRGSTSGGHVKDKSRRKARAREDSHDSSLDAPTAEADVGSGSGKQKAKSSKPKQEAESQKPQQEGGRPRPEGGEFRGGIAEILERNGADLGLPTGLPENCAWDPLGLAGGGQGPATPQGSVAVPEEWMRRLVGIQQQQRAQAQPPQPPSPAARPTTMQLRAQRKLQQRREALAQQQRGAAATVPQAAPEVEAVAPIDESWIDELEREESKPKSGGKKAWKANRKKQASTGKDAAQASANAPAEAAEDAAWEPTIEEDQEPGGEGYQYEETAVKTPPMAELVEPASQQEQASLEEAVGLVATKRAGKDEEAEEDDEAEDDEAEQTEEGAQELVDPDRLLGEAMHGLFMLVSSQGASSVKEGEKEKGDDEEAQEEEEAEEAEEEGPEVADEEEDEEEEEEEEEAEEDEAEEEEAEEEEAEEEEAEEEEAEEEAEEEEPAVEESAPAEPAEPAEQPSAEAPAAEEPAAEEPEQDEEPVLSAKQRKRRAKAAAAAAAANTPVSPLPGRTIANAKPEAASSISPKELPAQQAQRPGVRPPQEPAAAAPRPEATTGASAPSQPMAPAVRAAPAARPKAAAAKAGPAPAPARGVPAPGRVGVRLPSAAEQRAAAAAASGAAPNSARKPGDGGPPRAWASIVASWAKSDKRGAGEEAEGGEQRPQRTGSSLGGAEAPEFVPFSMMHQPVDDGSLRAFRQRQRKGGKHGGQGGYDGGAAQQQQQQSAGVCGQGEYDESFGEMVTTIMATGIDPKLTQDAFVMQLDSLGLIGTYDFLYLPMDDQTQMTNGCVLINFTDPAFVLLFCWIYHECQFPGTVTPAEVQGLEANRAAWEHYFGGEEMAPLPLIIPNPAPSQWSVNTVNAMLSPQFREQFRKTKMCVFHKKNRCEMGAGCPFAHSQSELMPAPDLAKTKLCFSYFRGRCSDQRCKFAHGSQELRSVWVPYSPGVWFFGSGEDAAGNQTYVQQEGDLQAGAVVGYPVMEQHLHGFLHGEVPMLGELPPYVQDNSSTDEQGENCDAFSNGGGAFGTAQCDKSSVSIFSGASEYLSQAAARDAKLPSYEVGDGVALRVRGTFMEAMRLRDPLEVEMPVRRSFSESDLEAFRAAMEESDV